MLAGKRITAGFCARFGLSAVPAAADTLVYYRADLQWSGVAVGTARQRLAAVRPCTSGVGWTSVQVTIQWYVRRCAVSQFEEAVVRARCDVVSPYTN